MKQLALPISLALGLTACASTSQIDDDIQDVRLADTQYAHQDEGMRWWRRHWVQPYAFFGRASYNASSWRISTDPQSPSAVVLQLQSVGEDRPGPRLEFRCSDGAQSFSFQDVTIFSPFHSSFEVFFDAQGERRWITIARRTSPRTLSIEDTRIVSRAFSELERATSFTIAVRDATPVRARFVLERSTSTFSDYRSRCGAQNRGSVESEGVQ